MNPFRIAHEVTSASQDVMGNCKQSHSSEMVNIHNRGDQSAPKSPNKHIDAKMSSLTHENVRLLGVFGAKNPEIQASAISTCKIKSK